MTVAPKADCKAGNATLTTVLSMKAMLLPRMAAARIHGPDWGRQGWSAVAERRMTSSQGGLMPELRMQAQGRRVRRIIRRRRRVSCGPPEQFHHRGHRGGRGSIRSLRLRG